VAASAPVLPFHHFFVRGTSRRQTLHNDPVLPMGSKVLNTGVDGSALSDTDPLFLVRRCKLCTTVSVLSRLPSVVCCPSCLGLPRNLHRRRGMESLLPFLLLLHSESNRRFINWFPGCGTSFPWLFLWYIPDTSFT
jgi:hypothetical protein